MAIPIEDLEDNIQSKQHGQNKNNNLKHPPNPKTKLHLIQQLIINNNNKLTSPKHSSRIPTHESSRLPISKLKNMLFPNEYKM